MELKEIQDLIKFVARSGATEVDLEMDGIKINIKTPGKKGAKGEETIVVQQVPVANPAPATMNLPSVTPAAVADAAPAQAKKPAAEEAAASEDANLITIKSPMIGTFYRKPGADKDAFVNVGDSVSNGQVVCIIEAMKLFNEIESEVSGKIVKVLVDDASPVEYDQPLFLVDPS